MTEHGNSPVFNTHDTVLQVKYLIYKDSVVLMEKQFSSCDSPADSCL